MHFVFSAVLFCPIEIVSACCTLFRAFIDASTLKKRRQTVLDQLGGHSQQGSVYNVLGKASLNNFRKAFYCNLLVLFAEVIGR